VTTTLLRIWLGFFTLLLAYAGQAQGIQTEFGKNRVQFTNDFDEWVQYESQNFVTYWYGEARTVGQAVVLIAEAEHDAIQRLMEHRVNDKLEIIVYNSISDLKQSNIGNEEAFTHVTGQTKIFENKIFVYYNGDYQHMRRQIRAGITGVYLESMLFGSNLQEFVQNTILFSMPDWFRQGLIDYVSKDWDVHSDDRLRQLLKQDKMTDFDKVFKADPALAGQAFWHFIVQQYGKTSVSNILYISRIYRDVDEGLLFVLGSPYSVLANAWYQYFTRRYQNEDILFDPAPEEIIPFKNIRNALITAMEVSPDGQHLAIVTNEIGKVKVWLYDVQKQSRKRIFSFGYRNAFQEADVQYPHIAWHPNNGNLAILYEKRKIHYLTFLDIKTGKKEKTEIPPIYQRVYSMQFYDTQKLLFTGSTSGVSDVFLYHIPTRQSERITNDVWDDLDATPFTYEGKKGILFSSNRPYDMIVPERLKNIPPVDTRDLFFHNYEEKGQKLVRVMNTSNANEIIPRKINDTWFTWLGEQNGIYNRYAAYLDSVLVRNDQYFRLSTGELLYFHGDSLDQIPAGLQYDTSWIEPIFEIWAYGNGVSNAGSNILMHTVDTRNQMVYEVRRDFEDQVIYKTRIDPNNAIIPANLISQTAPIRKRTTLKAKARLYRPVRDSIVYYFQSRFDYPKPENEMAEEELQEELQEVLETERLSGEKPNNQLLSQDSTYLAHNFISARIVPSRLQFRLDNVTNRFDNSLLFGGLDNFIGRRFLTLNEPQSSFFPPPIGLLVQAEVKDLFEDYAFVGGFRIPTNFRGTEFFLTFKDLKRRWDKHYSIYRGDWSNIFDLNQNVLNGPPNLVPPGLGGPGSPFQFKVRMQTTLAQSEWRYPLDIFRSVRLRATLRNDRYFWHALDLNTLAFPAVNEQRLGLRASYVFDNTLEVSSNILNGMRYNIFTEVVKGFQIQFDPFAFDLNKGFMGVAGIDFRYYLPVLKHSVLAARFNAMTSFGQERILFYLGGMDNWLLPQFGENVNVANEAYAFQTLAANLRGFRYNIRNGSSFALSNIELRVPFMRYLLPNSRSNFYRSLQVTGFFDVGTAWEGISPYDDENPLNIVELENPPAVFMRVKYFREPLVAGYGAGLRAQLFGYLVKLDYAWGIETRRVQEPILYLSVGADF
jgi:WD40 repeat protein